MEIRKMKSVNSSGPVPITARNVEAVQKLSETSAKMRLSGTISMEDAKFAKKVIIKSLKDVSMDAETGNLDAGIVNCGRSQSQAEKRRN